MAREAGVRSLTVREACLVKALVSGAYFPCKLPSLTVGLLIL